MAGKPSSPDAHPTGDRPPDGKPLSEEERRLKIEEETEQALSRLNEKIRRGSAETNETWIKNNYSEYLIGLKDRYAAAQGDLQVLAKHIGTGISSAPDVPDVLKEEINDNILPHLTHDVPSGDSLPDYSDFLVNEGVVTLPGKPEEMQLRVNMTNLKAKQDTIQAWLDSPVAQSNPDLENALKLTMGALNAYAQILDPGHAPYAGITTAIAEGGDPTGLLKGPLVKDPYIKDLIHRENQAVRLLGLIAFGGIGLIATAMGIKTKDFRMGALYLGIATLFAMGEKRLAESPDAALLREVNAIRITDPKGPYLPITTNANYEIRGEEWSKIAKNLAEFDPEDDSFNDITRKMERGDGLEDEDVQKLLKELAPESTTPGVKLQLENLIRGQGRAMKGEGHDFLMFVEILKNPRSETTQELLYKYIASGANPESVRLLRDEMEKKAKKEEEKK